MVILDIAGALAIAYAGFVMAIYTGRIWLYATLTALLIGAMVYFSL